MVMKPLAIMIGALLILSANAVEAKPHHRHSLPPYVRLTLAGVRLKDAREHMILFDPHSGYYLVGSSSDIGNRGLDLVPDLKRDFGGNQANIGALRIPIHRTSFPSLRTGWGVNIGDTQRQVRQKLGHPQSRRLVRNDVIDLQWNYHARLDGGYDIYDATYSFRHGWLREISYDYGPANQ